MPFAVQATKFEVDLLFPRNETYAPQALMPIVFAVQIQPALHSMEEVDMPIPGWELTRDGNASAPGSIKDGFIQSIWNGSSSTDYESTSVNTLVYPDSSWTLSWYFQPTNCTPGGELYVANFNGSVTFTTKKGAQLPDLVAATGPGACTSATGLAFNVVSATPQGCRILAPYENGTANPCAASLNATGAATILAEATSYACGYLQRPLNPNVTCPPLFPDSSSPDRYRASSYVYVWALLLAVAVVLNAPC